MRTKIITAVVIVLFASLAIYSYTTQENKLHIQQIELQKLNIDKKVLESESVKRKRTIDKLNSRIEELHKSGNEDKSKIDELNKQLDNAMQQLQAKAEEKNRLAKASTDVINVATNTRVASAAPVVGGNIQQIILDAANRYGVSSARLLAIAKCESTFSPTVVNHSYVAPDGTSPTGLFQYIGSTWRSFSSQAGYGGASIYDATAQANVTAWAFAHGYASHWECKA